LSADIEVESGLGGVRDGGSEGEEEAGEEERAPRSRDVKEAPMVGPGDPGDDLNGDVVRQIWD
jgi:hypothetical protein